MSEVVLSSKSKAVLFEISGALKRFALTGETCSIFINKMSLTDDERREIRDFLGLGSITIHLSDTAEPAEWMESGIAGIWYGVFYDQTKNPILETIEVCNYPQVASSQIEDINMGLQKLTQKLA